MTPTPQLFEAVSVERELPDTNCPVAIIQDGSSPFDSYFDGKNFIDEGVICNPSHWLRPISIVSEVTDDEVRDMAKNVVQYERQLALFGQKKADTVYHTAILAMMAIRDNKLTPTIAVLKSQVEHWQAEAYKAAQQCGDTCGNEIASLKKENNDLKEKSGEMAIGFAEWLKDNCSENHLIEAYLDGHGCDTEYLYKLYLASLETKNEGK